MAATPANVDCGYRTFLVGSTDIPVHSRVKLSSGLLVIAGVADREIGVIDVPGTASTYVPVRLRTADGTFIGIAGSSMSAGADVYTAANGKFDDATASTCILSGTSLVAASNAGDQIEILRHVTTTTAL